jgi:hypothetical protein
MLCRRGVVRATETWRFDASRGKAVRVCRGSPARTRFKLRGNIPPNWISRARGSRKSFELDLVASMKKLRKLRKSRPKAHATIKAADQELKALLKAWELAYRKETFSGRGERI